jgi:aspartyl-tRNA(Asn)/glutamyl-tRNA(Gln) amidotransferase subunit C
MDGKPMRDEITPELFTKLVDLAAFAFDQGEAEYLRKELNNQLKAIHQLKTAQLDPSVPHAFHGVTYTPESSPPLRADVWMPCENPDEILTQAPQVDEGHFIVPDIPHTELE